MLTNLIDGNNFTGGLLDLLQATHEVPVTRLGDNIIGSKDPHPIETGFGLSLGGQMTPNNLVFLKAA